MECFFDRYAKEPNQYEIEKVALIRATNRLRIEIAADTIVPYTEITTIKEDLKDLLPDVSGVDLFFDYRQINSPSEGDILAYLPYLVGEIAKEDAFYAHSISTTDVKVKENTIYILALGEKVTKVLNKKVAGIFQGLLQDAFGISFQVVFTGEHPGRADRAAGDAALPLLRIGAHRRLTLSAVCDDVVVAGLICPQGLWPLSLLTEGTVVAL